MNRTNRNARKAAALLALASLAAALTGCNVGPDYHTPAIPVEPSYSPTSPQSAQQTSWWTTLNDPQLTALLATAAAGNLDLQKAQARIVEARAQRDVIFGGELPDLNASGEYQHDRFSQNAAPFNAFNIPGFPWEYNLYQAGFDASWEIDVFGGTRRAVQSATASLQASQEDKNAVLISLLGEVARNYVELRGYQQERQIAQQNFDAQNQTLELTRDREKNGVGNDLDVSRANALVAETAAQIPVYQREESQTLDRLVVLTNQPLEKLEYLRTIAPIPTAPEAVSAGIPAELLRRRPDIRGAERRLAAATAQIGVAEAELYPKFSISGYFDMQSASTSDLLNWKSRAFSLGPTVTWPIFEGGSLRAAVKVRNAQQEQALITYEQTVQQAIQEVRDQLVAFSTERIRRASLAQAVNSDQEAVDLSNQLYRQGLVDFLNVLDAQRQLYNAQDSLAQSDAQLSSSLIALYKALGGGWENPPAATAPGTNTVVPTPTGSPTMTTSSATQTSNNISNPPVPASPATLPAPANSP